MKLFHISDLHIGIRLHEAPLWEDQRYILNQILDLCAKEKPDGIIIAGDIYDRSVPGAEAVEMFDGFLTGLRDRKIAVFAISGNHDSAERIAYASRIMSENNIFMSRAYSGHTEPVVMHDDYGKVNIYLLPFITPRAVRRFCECEIESYDDAVRYAVEEMNIDTSERNVIAAHQFVTGAKTSESDEITVGGTDNISAEIFCGFDYAALGHIHRPQMVKSEFIRYSGTPIKYSFSECDDNKAVQVIELLEKGTVKLSSIPLLPLHDMRKIRGTYNEITDYNFYKGTDTEDYVYITLTDEEEIPYAFEKLRTIYKNLLRFDYDNVRSRHMAEDIGRADSVRPPEEMFAMLYEKQNGEPLDEERAKIVREIIAKIQEGE